MTSPKMTFINLPVSDLPKTIAFYTALGFSFNPQFTDETGTCMIINDNTFCRDPDGHRWEPFVMDMTQMPKS
jgi:predicted lactoylglutathione lyase